MTAEEELKMMASIIRRPYPPPESAPALFAIALELVALWESPQSDEELIANLTNVYGKAATLVAQIRENDDE